MTLPIAITSVGLVTSAAVESEACWQALCAPPAPPRALEGFDESDFEQLQVHQIRDWKAANFWRRRSISRYTRSAQFALKASEQCLGGLEEATRGALGVVLGTQFSTVHNFHRVLEEPEYMTPIKFLAALPSSTPTNVSISLKLHGISTSVSSSVAGLEAISYGAEMLRDGYCPALLAGGVEELSADVLAGCVRARVLAPQPSNGHRRGGLTLGEAASVLLLETGAHAAAGGRRPLAFVAGWGATHAALGRDAVNGAGYHAMRQALAMAGIDAGEVDVLFDATSGWRIFDSRDERERAVLFALGRRPRISLKRHTGEIFGAFGALATAAAAISLDRQQLPGQSEEGQSKQDQSQLERRLETVLIHDRGWDGSHAALVLVRPDAAREQPSNLEQE